MIGVYIDDHRALTIATSKHKYYVDPRKMGHTKWPEWEANPPIWFGPKFIAALRLNMCPSTLVPAWGQNQ